MKIKQATDYGDFTEYQIRCLIAEYCRALTVGTIGWGVPFKSWVELRGIAKHQKLFQLKRIGFDGGCETCKTLRILPVGPDKKPETFVWCAECKRNTFHFYDTILC